MHVTQLWVSQALSEEESICLSAAVVVLLRFGFWIGKFLCAFTGYEDGAAVFEVLFNLAKIHLFCFLNLNIVAGVVV
jgi:hypothetical protein